MTRRKSDKHRAKALRLLATGMSFRGVAEQCKASESWVRKIARAQAADAEASALADELDDIPVDPPPARDADPPADAELPDVEISDDVYEHTRQMMRRSMAISAAASRDGNHRAAQQAQRDVAAFTTILARLDKDRRAGSDVVTIPRADFERAKLQIHERVRALQADVQRTGGLVCSSCGRQIRIALAKGE